MPNKYFQQGHLLLIKDYCFQDGNGSKDKFLIVINKNDDYAYIIHTLTTSQNSRNFPAQNFGCKVEGITPYFFIPQDKILGEKGFKFKKDTFIFFQNNIRKEELTSLMKYAGKGIELIEKLPLNFVQRLLKCMLKSDFITLSLEKELIQIKESLALK